MTQSLMLRARFGFMALLLIVMLALPVLTRAETTMKTVNDSTINSQTFTVQESLVTTMTEYVKLLQLILIQRLEVRLAALQAMQK